MKGGHSEKRFNFFVMLSVLSVGNAVAGDDHILMLDLVSGQLEVFAESINGADGIALDKEGLL